jgi:hypothetical protein
MGSFSLWQNLFDALTIFGQSADSSRAFIDLVFTNNLSDQVSHFMLKNLFAEKVGLKFD